MTIWRPLGAEDLRSWWVAQRIERLYSLVTIPAIYNFLQDALGGMHARQVLVGDIVRPRPGMHVLDVGCGPGTLFPFLRGVAYTGLDLNEKHIAAARKQFGDHGVFRVGDASRMETREIGTFDLVIVSGLLHHLSDAEGRALFASLGHLLKPAGRIVTIDPVWVPHQRLIARVMKRLDSGLNIRTPAQYHALLDGMPYRIETRLYDDLLRVPYDHFCMTLTRKA